MAVNTSRFFSSSLLLLLTACAGGGGGGGSGGPVLPPAGPTAFTLQTGLTGAAAGSNTIRLTFVPSTSPDFQIAAFVATNVNNLFGTAPRVPAIGATSLTVNGLTNGTVHFLGLGIRPTGSAGAFTPVGPVLTARPGAPLFVDASSGAANPDGLTPATAFPDLLSGFLTAFANGGGNVWVRGGNYTAAALPLATGVSVQGGFGPAFDLATRDPVANRTLFNVPAAQVGIEVGDPTGNELAGVLDGIELEGNDAGSVGVDVIDSAAELRGVIVTDMADRGIRARNSLTDRDFDLVITACESTSNGADGLSGSGPFDYRIFDSLFSGNVQEGFDLDGLVPETGGTATLDINSSRFFGNGAEGVDATLALPLVPTSGTYSVRIRGSAFERNTLAGCLIDHDYELTPGYSSDVTVRESFARANALQGFHLDLDAPGTASLSRLLATSNGSDGLYVTSESDAGLVVVTTSAFIGNASAGIRIEGPPALVGNRSLAATHCLFAGNAGAGMVSRDLDSTATSSIAYLQPNAYSGVTLVGSVATNDPAAMGFVRAPEEYALVLARSGATLTLASAPSFTTAFELELADDTVVRSASTVAGSVVTLSAAPSDFATPGLLSAFDPGPVSVAEDYHLLGGSIAIGAGMGGASVDAGPFGSPVAGTPGFTDEEPVDLFFPVATAPTISTPVLANQSLTITFSANLNGASANAGTVRARRNGNALSISMQSAGATLTIDPPGGGWGAGDFRLELDRGLRSAAGVNLSAPVALQFSR